MTKLSDKTNPVASLPGSRWLEWVHHRPLRVGVLAGIYLTAVMVVSLMAANRVPALEPLAPVRNLISYAAFALVAALPVWIFRREPGGLFTAGLTAWGIFSLMYGLSGILFDNLFVRMRMAPGHAFMLGAIVYGLLAVVAWVSPMVSALFAHPVAASRRRP